MTWSHTSRLLVTAAAAVVVVAGIKAASDIIGPLVLALALTIVFHPLRSRLGRRLPSWAATAVLILCAYALVLSLVVSMVVALGQMAVLVPTYAPEVDDLVRDVGGWLDRAGVGSDQVAAATGALDTGRLVDFVTNVLSGVLGLLSSIVFLGALLLFLAFDAAKAGELAEGARADHPGFVEAMTSFANGTRRYLGVSAIFGLIVAVIDTAALYVLGVPGAFVWGVLAFVTNFVPNIGFVIGLVPPAIIALLDGGPDAMLAVVVVYCVVNLVIQSVIQPKVVGNAVGLSTTLTFVSLVFWTWVLGPIGAILAVPMSLFFKAVLLKPDPSSGWVEPLVSGQPRQQPGGTS